MNLNNVKGINASTYRLVLRDGSEYSFTWPLVCAKQQDLPNPQLARLPLRGSLPSP